MPLDKNALSNNFPQDFMTSFISNKLDHRMNKVFNIKSESIRTHRIVVITIQSMVRRITICGFLEIYERNYQFFYISSTIKFLETFLGTALYRWIFSTAFFVWCNSMLRRHFDNTSTEWTRDAERNMKIDYWHTPFLKYFKKETYLGFNLTVTIILHEIFRQKIWILDTSFVSCTMPSVSKDAYKSIDLNLKNEWQITNTRIYNKYLTV